jgi:predicted small lipoprotein YifL
MLRTAAYAVRCRVVTGQRLDCGMDGGAMLNCLRIALVCGIVLTLTGCGKKGPLDAPDAPEGRSGKFDVKAYTGHTDNNAPKATPPKDCKPTILDPLIGAECPPPKQ